eukprot:jgi/Bigna1/136785/aug1.35_g11493
MDLSPRSGMEIDSLSAAVNSNRSNNSRLSSTASFRTDRPHHQVPLFRFSEDGSSHNRGGLGSDILLSPHTPASSNSHDAWPSFKDPDKLHRFSSLTGSSGRNSHVIDSQKLFGSMRRGESKFGNNSSNSGTPTTTSINKNKVTLNSIPRYSPRATTASPTQKVQIRDSNGPNSIAVSEGSQTGGGRFHLRNNGNLQQQSTSNGFLEASVAATGSNSVMTTEDPTYPPSSPPPSSPPPSSPPPSSPPPLSPPPSSPAPHPRSQGCFSSISRALKGLVPKPRLRVAVRLNYRPVIRNPHPPTRSALPPPTPRASHHRDTHWATTNIGTESGNKTETLMLSNNKPEIEDNIPDKFKDPSEIHRLLVRNKSKRHPYSRDTTCDIAIGAEEIKHGTSSNRDSVKTVNTETLRQSNPQQMNSGGLRAFAGATNNCTYKHEENRLLRKSHLPEEKNTLVSKKQYSYQNFDQVKSPRIEDRRVGNSSFHGAQFQPGVHGGNDGGGQTKHRIVQDNGMAQREMRANRNFRDVSVPVFQDMQQQFYSKSTNGNPNIVNSDLRLPHERASEFRPSSRITSQNSFSKNPRRHSISHPMMLAGGVEAKFDARSKRQGQISTPFPTFQSQPMQRSVSNLKQSDWRAPQNHFMAQAPVIIKQPRQQFVIRRMSRAHSMENPKNSAYLMQAGKISHMGGNFSQTQRRGVVGGILCAVETKMMIPSDITYKGKKYIGPTLGNRPTYKSKQTWRYSIYPHGVSEQNGKLRVQIKRKGLNPTYPPYPNTIEGLLEAAYFRDQETFKLWRAGILVRKPKFNFEHNSGGGKSSFSPIACK